MSPWFQKPSRTLVAVTGSQQPYLFDLPHVLSLPIGFEFRFRYGHRWVADQVREELKKAPQCLVGRRLLLVFHSELTRRILPLRECTVLGVENLGPMVLLRFTVGRFAKVEIDLAAAISDEAVRQAAQPVADRGRRLIDPMGTLALESPLGDKHYLTEISETADADIWSSDDDLPTAWASLVSILQKEPSLRGVPFFFVLGFQTESRKAVPARPAMVRRRAGSSYRYYLTERHRYHCRLVQWADTPKGQALPQVKVQCQHDATSLQLEGAWNLVVGRYDTLDFTFIARHPGQTELAFSAEPLRSTPAGGTTSSDQAKAGTIDLKWMDWPTIFVARIPIKVRHQRVRVAVTGLLGALAMWCYVFPPTWWRIPPSVYQIGGLWVAFFVLGEYVERFVKAREHVMKIAGTEPSPAPRRASVDVYRA